MPVDQAITTSLLIICITSIGATSQYAKQKYVLCREGSLLGLSGIVGAAVAAQLSVMFPSQALLLILAAMMLASSIAILCNKNETLLCNLSPTKQPPVSILTIGLLISIVTGMVGADGGFLVVPALVVLLIVPLPIAIGTSLFVISLNTASGFIAHYQNSTLDVKLIAIISLLAVVGTLIGEKIAIKMSINTLRKNFPLFIIVTLLLIASELPVAIQQDWFKQHHVLWSLLILAIISSLFYFLTRSCLSKIWRVPFIINKTGKPDI